MTAGLRVAGAVALAALAGCRPADRPSASADVQALVARAEALNSACRGGRGDDPATVRACDDRDAAVRQLAARGWCYGTPSDIEAQKEWQRCADAE